MDFTIQRKDDKNNIIISGNSFKEAIATAVKNCEYLSYAVLKGIDLADIDLWGANLFGAVFNCVDLSNTTLRAADLRYAKFCNCKFKETDFSCCDLRHAIFSSSNLSYSNFEGADISCADFTGAVMHSVCMTNISAVRTKFTDAELDNAELQGDFCSSSFIGTRFGRAKLSGEFSKAYFSESNLSQAIYDDSILSLSSKTIYAKLSKKKAIEAFDIALTLLKAQENDKNLQDLYRKIIDLQEYNFTLYN